MNKKYFQSLIESVTRRKNNLNIPIYHKDSPIGKYISKEKHDSIVSQHSNPFESLELFKTIANGVKRGKVGNSKNISYQFNPYVKYSRKKKQVIHHKGSESGNHFYSFKTKNGKEVTVAIRHEPVTSLRDNLKGRFTRSKIMFDVDGYDQAKSKTDNTSSIQTIRGVVTAINHHMKSHAPDIIQFSADHDGSPHPLGYGGSRDKRNRVKMYKYLVNKFSKKNYESRVITPKDPYASTKFFLYNKKSRTNPQVETAAKKLINLRAKKNNK